MGAGRGDGTQWGLGTDLVEVCATPLRGVLASVAVKDGEVALATDASEVNDERVCVLHGIAVAPSIVYTDLVRAVVVKVLVQCLGRQRLASEQRLMQQTSSHRACAVRRSSLWTWSAHCAYRRGAVFRARRLLCTIVSICSGWCVWHVLCGHGR